jgi:hypothetical protein
MLHGGPQHAGMRLQREGICSMADQHFSSIELSQDELAFILTLFSLNEISGFSVPADFDDTAASAAGDSLMARGLAVDGDGGQTIHPDIAALVTSGALYSVALGLSLQKGSGAPTRYWFYLSPDRVVYHSKPRLGIERFEALPDADTFFATLSDLINGTDGAAPGYGVFAVGKSILAQAEMARANSGDEAAYRALTAQNLPESFAQNVLDERNQIIIVTIRVIESPKTPVRAETDTTMLISTGSGYWLLREDEADAEQLIAKPVDTAGALDFIAQLAAL